MRQRYLMVSVFLLGLFTSWLHAQVATGIYPLGTFAGGPDVVNLQNLNDHFTFNILHKPGVQMPFTFSISYDSAIWKPVAGAWTPTGNWGWNTQTNAFSGYTTYKLGGGICPGTRCSLAPSCCGAESHTLQSCYMYNTYSNWEYVQNNNATHSFSGEIADYSECPAGHKGTLPASMNDVAANDNSGFSITANAGTSLQGPSSNIYDAKGNTIYDPQYQQGSIPANLIASASIVDAYGTNISTTGTVYTDSLGMTALTVSGDQTAGGSTTYTYTDADGNAETFKVIYGSYIVRTNFGCTGVTEYNSGTTYIPLVSEIHLPNYTTTNNEKYTFHYEHTPGFSGDRTGRIASITLPTGQSITYAYSGGTNGIECTDGSTPILTRTTPDGTWTYTRAVVSDPEWTTTVQDPMGNNTQYYFEGPYQTERDVYQGAVQGSPLDTTYTCYGGTAFPCNGSAISSISPINITTQDDEGLESTSTTTLDNYGNPTEIDQTAFFTGSGLDAVLRKTIIDYANYGVNGTVNERPTSVTAEDSGGTILAQTNFTNNSQGDPTSIARLVSGSSFDTTNIAYNSNGTLASVQTPNGHTTTYTYDSSICDGAFPTKTTFPISPLSTSTTWNCYAGLPLAVTNLNGQATTFHYDDPFSRLTQIDAPGGSEAVIQYNDNAGNNSSTIDRYISTTADTLPASDTGWRHEQDTYDWAGRETQHELVNDPAGPDFTVTSYNGDGEIASITNPYRSTSDPTYGVTQFSYDALGRIKMVTNPDASISHIYYGTQVGSNNGLTTSQCSSQVYPIEAISAAGRYDETWLDADGNTIEADEPNPASGSLTSGEYNTCYSYDALDRLTLVNDGGQKRSLAYDDLGNVLYSYYPEAAATLSGPSNPAGGTNWSEAMTYDADGNLLTREDANNVTTSFDYDALDRLTSESFTDSTPKLTFIYDSNSGCNITSGGGLLGRLACANSANGTWADYGYNAAGEVSDLWQQAPDVQTHQAYTYFYNGQVNNYTNPGGYTFTYALDNPGRVTNITAPSNWNSGETVFGNAAYTPFEALASATVGPETLNGGYNDDLETTEITSTVNGTKDFDRGYGYDADGLLTSNNDNINTTYNRTFAYDALGRIASLTAPNNTQANTTYTIDRWGNVTNASNLDYFNFVMNSSNNNQIQGWSYDNDGNTLNDTTNTYAWNALGQVTGLNNGSSTYN